MAYLCYLVERVVGYVTVVPDCGIFRSFGSIPLANFDPFGPVLDFRGERRKPLSFYKILGLSRKLLHQA